MIQELGLADHIVRTDSVFRYVVLRHHSPYWIGCSLLV